MERERTPWRPFREILEDYRYNPDVMSEENEMVARFKEIIFHRLSESDRTIIIVYAEHPSYRDVGQILGVSHTTAGEEIKRVKGNIMRWYWKMKKEDERIRR